MVIDRNRGERAGALGLPPLLDRTLLRQVDALQLRSGVEAALCWSGAADSCQTAASSLHKFP